MSRTIRTTPLGTVTRDGKIERSTRRPHLTTRRTGTRAAVIAAALADYATEV